MSCPLLQPVADDYKHLYYTVYIEHTYDSCNCADTAEPPRPKTTGKLTHFSHL